MKEPAHAPYQPRRDWTDGESKFLRANYPRLTYTELGEALGRTRNSVAGRVRQLGLTVNGASQGRPGEPRGHARPLPPVALPARANPPKFVSPLSPSSTITGAWSHAPLTRVEPRVKPATDPRDLPRLPLPYEKEY